MEKRKTLALDVALAFALFFAGLKLTAGIGEYLDLSLFDEPGYLERGARWWTDGVPLVPQLAPLYSLWYAGLIAAFGKVSAFFWNARLLVALIPVAVFFVARSRAAPIPTAFAALFLLTNQGLLTQWPKAGHFACLIFLFALALALRVRHRATRLAVIGLGVGLATVSYPWPAGSIHLAHLLNLPAAVIRSCFTHWPFILPTAFPRASTVESLALCAGVGWALRSRGNLRLRLKAVWCAQREVVVLLTLPLLPAILTALYAEPIPGHLLWVSVLFSFFVAWALTPIFEGKRISATTVLVPLAIVAITPTVGSRWITPYLPLTPHRDYVMALSALTLKARPEPYRLAANPEGHHAFLDERFVPCPSGGKPFKDVVARCNPDLILSEEEMFKEAFTNAYSNAYVIRLTPKQRKFLVKADALATDR